MENNNWPIYSKNNLILGDLKSEVAIITLWTPTKQITEKLDKNLFCVAGQLYSKSGINYIIRNILANPSIHYLIICGQDLSGSGKALLNFFKKGIDENYNIIGSDFALIHKEIPRQALELIRKNVQIKDLIDIKEIEKINQELKFCSLIGKPFAKSQLFTEHKEEESLSFPAEQSVFKIREEYIGPAWLRILKLILKFGAVNKSWYGNEVREIFNVAAVISHENRLEPQIFPFFRLLRKTLKNISQAL